MKRIGFAIAFALFPAAMMTSAQSTGVFGDWKSTAGSIVRIERCGMQICMKLVQILNTNGITTDTHNPDASMRQRPLCGLQIGSGFRPTDANHATDGTLYDPKTGKTYRGTMAAQGSTLHLRGYIGTPLFGETQDWKRPNEPVNVCSAAGL